MSTTNATRRIDQIFTILDRKVLVQAEYEHQRHAINQMPLIGWVKLADELGVDDSESGRHKAASILAIYSLERRGLV